MPVKLNQSKVSLKLLKEKSDSIILGEILHYIWESFLTSKKEIFHLYADSEEFKNIVENYIKKALASYPEPLAQRRYFFKKAKEIIESIFRSEEFKKFKELIREDNLSIYKETEGFFEEENQIQDLRPDIIIRKPKECIVFEFKLHGDFDKTQLKKYFTLLKKVFPDDNIKVYLISFEPFKVELIYDFPSHPTQLPLFENLG